MGVLHYILGFFQIPQKLNLILRRLNTIMSTQEEFDTKINEANTALDTISNQIAAEAEQIAQFIRDNPGVNTSALDGVVARLNTTAESVGTIFTPPAEEEAE